MPHDPYAFDIDVDLSEVLGRIHGPVLVNADWYDLVRPREGRCPQLQAKLDEVFRNVMMQAQWGATSRRKLDRRRAVRAPLLSRVHVTDGSHLVACDISMSGLRCSGNPTAPLMDVDFRLPGTSYPIDARVEVVSYKDSSVIPLVGLRFAWIDQRYIDHIARYVSERRERVHKIAA